MGVVRQVEGGQAAIIPPHQQLSCSRAVSGCPNALSATWLRCRVHFMRNALVPRWQDPAAGGVRLLGDRISPRMTRSQRKAQWRQVAEQLRPRVPKLSAFMDEAEADV